MEGKFHSWGSIHCIIVELLGDKFFLQVCNTFIYLVRRVQIISSSHFTVNSFSTVDQLC